MPRSTTIIYLHAGAPRKPPEGAACNGCGVCCATAPCPLGMLLSRKRRGACKALLWSGGGARYACGALIAPQTWLPWLPRSLARRLVLRWIAATRGCDSDLTPERNALPGALARVHPFCPTHRAGSRITAFACSRRSPE